jgi:hypothetical protein
VSALMDLSNNNMEGQGSEIFYRDMETRPHFVFSGTNADIREL